jgi:hypothetical protein
MDRDRQPAHGNAMQLIDPTHRFYRPLYIRVIIVAVCLSWAIVEATTGEPFWAVLVGAVGVYSAWMLLLNYKPPLDEEAKPLTDDPEEGQP